MSLFVPKDRRSLFRQFLAGMYDAVVITDPNGHVLDINARATEHFGYELDEVLDRPVSLYIPGLKPEVVARIRKGLEGDRHVMIDANGRTKAGDKIACEVTVSVIDLTNPGDLVFTIRNIEKRRLLMNALRTKANAYAIASCALFACDETGRFTEANAAFRTLFGLAEDEDIGSRAFADFMNDEPLPEHFKKALAGERTTTCLSAENESGVSEELEIVLAPNTVGRKILGVVGSIRKAVV